MSKRLFALAAAAVLLLALAASALADSAMQQGSMYVNTANGRALRFRSSKSTSADNVLAEIPYGTKVYVLDWDGTWARVRYNSAVGYVVKKHLSIARPEDFATVQAQKAQEKAAREQEKIAQAEAKEQERIAQAEAKEQEKALKEANSKLDHSKVMDVLPYDVTVRTGVVGLSANVYYKADLTSKVTETYEEGVRLVVQAANKDWAKVYNGANDHIGFMLLEDLEPDLMEDELLEDD